MHYYRFEDKLEDGAAMYTCAVRYKSLRTVFNNALDSLFDAYLASTINYKRAVAIAVPHHEGVFQLAEEFIENKGYGAVVMSRKCLAEMVMKQEALDWLKEREERWIAKASYRPVYFDLHEHFSKFSATPAAKTSTPGLGR